MNNIQFKNSEIYKEIINNTMMHSIMLISNDTEMLDIYANNIVSTMFCKAEEKPCEVCTECQKIAHKTMVDVLEYPLKGEVLKSDELNKLLDTVFELPFEHDKKVYIINNFSSIDALMQNKLLKTLEEPPSHAYFILKVDNESVVLQTIKSRCQKIMLPKLDTISLQECLNNLGTDIELVDEAMSFCGGSLAQAKQYINSPNFLNNVNFLLNMLQNLKKSWQVVDYASVLYTKKDEILDILHIYLKILQDSTYLALGLDDLITLKTHTSELKFIAEEYSLDAMSQMIKDVNLILEKLDRNCNFNSIIDEFLLGILEDKHKWPI